MSFRRLVLLLGALLFSCAPASQPLKNSPKEVVVNWSGRIEINETLKLPTGAKLVIAPGTTIVFGNTDQDSDGMGDAAIVIDQGELVALGTPDAPIIFTSKYPPNPGNWGEIRMDFSKIALAYTVIEGSTRGLHIHFSSGKISDSIFRQNLDSTRLGECHIDFDHCLFSQNSSKGFNARASTNKVENSWFRGNRRGVFLFEDDRESKFSGNLFTDNVSPVKLGDFFSGEVVMTGSSLGDGTVPLPHGPAGYLSDPDQKALLTWTPGDPVGAGPRGWPLLTPVWEMAMGGFVDADANVLESGAFVSDWGGTVYRLGIFDGKSLATVGAGDIIDSRIAATRVNGRPLAALQTWERKILLLDGDTLQILDTFTEEESPADDHRQSDPLFDGDDLYIGTWAGKVHAFDVTSSTLQERWSFDAKSPIRGGLVLAGGHLLVPTESGVLYCLDKDGTLIWSADLGSPLLSTPLAVEKMVLVGTKGGKLSGVEVKQGKILWQEELCGPAWFAPPAVQDNTVFQGDDAGCLTAFSLTQKSEKWRIQLDGPVRTRPAVTDAGIVVTTLGGSVYLLNPADGFVFDRIQYTEQLNSSPVHLGDRVFFGGRDGKFRSLSAGASAR